MTDNGNLDFLKDLEELEQDDFIEESNDIEDFHNTNIDILDIKEHFPVSKENAISSSILNDKEFLKHIEKIANLLNSEIIKENLAERESQEIKKSNQYTNIIDREISTMHKCLRDNYIEKFPELETIVLDPMSYAMAVMRIQNESDLNKLEFSDFLTNHQIVAIQVSGSSIGSNNISASKLSACLDICQKIFPLDQYKRLLLKYVESRMLFIAPNLSAFIGTEIATKLMATAGGLDALAKMPACNIQVLGKTRKNLLGFSKDRTSVHVGVFSEMEIFQDAPPDHKMKIVRMLSTNCAKAVRVDVCRMCPSGSLGQKFKSEMMARFSKVQEPAPAKLVKPLPAPDPKPKKRRGGARHRRMKEKLGLTEVRKLRNRMKFGEEGEDEFRETGKGFGMLGKAGKVKVVAIKKQNLLSKKQKNMLAAQSSGATNGMASSIVFTPMQGMHLVNPDSQLPKQEASNQYFKNDSGFKTVLAQRKSGVLTSILGIKH